MSDITILALGTSIMWGQGLEDPDKMHNALRKMLQKQFPDRTVTVNFLAHSGSTTGYKQDGSLDTRHEPRIHGEVPTDYPTIVQQIEEFDTLAIDRDDVDLILLDAGVNDVRVERILDPAVRPHIIESLVEMYCHRYMVLLLESLTTKFKNAKILVIAYYQMLTEQSEEEYIHTLLKAFGKVPVGFVADAVVDVFNPLMKHRVLSNSETFASASLAAFQQSAEQVNAQLTDKRIFIVPPTIDATHSALTPDPWLFGINEDLSPQDTMSKIRAEQCHCAPPHRTEPVICEKASAGHPNPKGANAFAEAMRKIIMDNGLL
jgi:lysophospholipase L1-like esterase